LGGVWLTVDPIGSRMGKRGRVPKLGFSVHGADPRGADNLPEVR
jgi:hypothetical protein